MKRLTNFNILNYWLSRVKKNAESYELSR